MTYNPNRPVMFPCATQVSLIQVGADDFDLKVKDQLKFINPSGPRYTRKAEEPPGVSKQILKSVSTGLSFTNEVVRDMAPYTIPYSEQSIYDAYDTSEFLSRAEKKLDLPSGRFNNYGPDRRHMSCYFKKHAPYRLKPIKRAIMKRAMEMQKQEEKQLQELAEQEGEGEGESGFFLTEQPRKHSQLKKWPLPDRKRSASPTRKEAEVINEQQSEEKSESAEETKSADKGPDEKEKHKWDEYLLSILSRPTAQWIVTQRTDPCDKRFKPLYEYVVHKHGVPTSTELVRDNMAEYEDEPPPKPVVKKVDRRPNTQSARLLQRVHDMEEGEDQEELDTVPYADRNNASFYRQPGGIKKKIKIQQKEMEESASSRDLLAGEAGALNTTATSIVVKTQELPPPPKLSDFVDARITENTVYETDNNYQRDWLTGTQQVYQAFGDDNEIVMDNHNKYTKVRQVQYPRNSTEWSQEQPLREQGNVSPNLVHKQHIGQQRWTGLPKPVEDSSAMIAGVVEEIEQSMNPSVEKFQPSEALSRIVDEWRSKWHLNMRFDDASPEELIRDMEDIHPHVRIKAISTCARAAHYKPPPLEGIQLYTVKRSEKAHLPEKIFVALQCLLNDEHAKVRLAAAISLHALQRPNEEAENVLRYNLLPDQNRADRWAAVQCLGFYGVTDSDVIGECVDQMMSNEDMILYEKACSLLSHISENTNLVHSMLAEHLNDCSWRHRIMSLKCLPKLYGGINIDIQNKIMHIMWNDSHSDVRKAAAQSLGKCGYGRLVHDKMIQILMEGTQTERSETLSKIGYLGIMTAKMMLPFVRAFRDEYVAVRKEACISAGNLKIQDESLIAELLRLSNRDPIWRIKALAIQALGKIGIPLPEIRKALLWALRFEEEEGVRAEACHSIILLQLKDTEVLEILQNRMLVEESPIVQGELEIALELNGVSATEDMAMVAQIKAEVRKLSNRNDIYNSICVLEKEETLQENTKRMIYIPKTPKTPKRSRQTQLEDEFDDGLLVDQTDDIQDEAAYPRPPSISHKTFTTTVSETIPEVDEEYHIESARISEKSEKVKPSSARSKRSARSRSGKSRPVSGVSSLNTEMVDRELEEALQTGRRQSEEGSEAGQTQRAISEQRESQMSTGYERKRVSESRAVSVTPTVLSITLDQIEAIHSDEKSVVERLRTMSVDNETERDDDCLTMSPSQVKVAERTEGTRASSMGTTFVRPISELKMASAERSVPSSAKFLGTGNFKDKPSDIDPVDMARLQSTNFLFDRYSYVDIKTPDTFSSADLIEPVTKS